MCWRLKKCKNENKWTKIFSQQQWNIISGIFHFKEKGVTRSSTNKNNTESIGIKKGKELKSFFELVNFYRQYLSRYTELTKQFAKLRKRNVEFDQLKLTFAKRPIVEIFDPTKDITLTTDASKHSISGILSQEGHPIMYLSKRLTGTKLNYSNIEKEVLVIEQMTTRTCQFLIRKSFC